MSSELKTKTWSWSIGTPRRGRVKVYEHKDKSLTLYLIWSEMGQQYQKSLGRHLRTDSGKVLKETEKWAKEQARRKHEELLARAAGYLPPPITTAPESGFTIAQAIDLVQDPTVGKYPKDTLHRREVLRSLQYAKNIWGPNRTWASIDKWELHKIGRQRLRDLLAEGKRGARTAEKMIEHIIAVANWLRDKERIPTTACVPSKEWTRELYEDWRTLAESDQDYQVQTPRHSLDEARAIMRKAIEVDPRFHLLLALGADLRLGQVVRARRSQLNLEDNTFIVYGRGRKKGTTIELTPGQCKAVDWALQGYLAELEANCPDYPLFPGRYATKKGAFVKPDAGYLHKQTVLRWFKQAEELAEVPHIKGRCGYGIRRLAVDELLGHNVSLIALQNNGGWSDPTIPTQKYADQQSIRARREAAQARAQWRGEASEIADSVEL